MSDRTIRFLDTGYKIAVMIGSILMVVMNATFAKRGDIDGLKKSIAELTGTVAITNNNAEHVKESISQIGRRIDDHESRLRGLETKR